VLLLEPVELRGTRPLNVMRSLAKRVLRGRSPIYEMFEPVGNYIFRLSLHEVFRMMTAIQKPWFAARTFNDFTTRGLIGKSRGDKLARAFMGLGILAQDLPSACGLMSPGMGAVFVPTGADDDRTKAALKQSGFRIIETPKNPYPPDAITKKFLDR
jgi:hypothetical protein